MADSIPVLEREIRKYNILAHMSVRGGGSTHKGYTCRALWDVCGKPSIQWALEAVKGSKYIDKVAVFTESEKIKKVVRKIKGITLVDRPLYTALNVPRDYNQGTFKRNKPRSIISREALVFFDNPSYVDYYIEETEGFIPDIKVYFSADAPLVTSDTYDRLIRRFFENELAGRAFCVFRVPMQYLIVFDEKSGLPFYVLWNDQNRQKCLPLYRMGGPKVDGTPSKLDSDTPSGEQTTIEINMEEGEDIHTPEDLFRVRCYMKQRLLKKGEEVEWSIGSKDEKYEVKEN